MKKTWKLVTIVIILAIIVGVIISNSANGVDQNFSLGIANSGSNSVKKGEQITIELKPKEGYNISSISNVMLKYDTKVLQGVSSAPNAINFDTGAVNYTSETDTIQITFKCLENTQKNNTSISLEFEEGGNITCVPASGTTGENINISSADGIDSLNISIEGGSTPVNNLTVDNDKLNLEKGKSNNVKITGGVNDGDEVDWASTNTDVATVSDTSSAGATITAVGDPGSTTNITVTNKTTGGKVSITVTVEKSSEPEINPELTISRPTINVGDTTTATASGFNGNVTFTSNKPEIATVDNSGKITGKSIGNATITATDGTNSKTATISVNQQSGGNTISVSPENLNVNVGGTGKISVVSGNVTNWKSNDITIATVDNSGNVKGIKEGKTQIIASNSDGASATVNINVTKAGDNTVKYATPMLDPSEKLNLTVGETGKISVTNEGANGCGNVTKWTSSNTNVATVDNSGTVTAISSGQANITVTAEGGVSKGVVVFVNEKNATLDPEQPKLNDGVMSYGLAVGDTGEINSDKKVSWVVEDSSIIQTVSSESNKITIKGLKVGTTKITATTDGGRSTVITVTVAEGSAAVSYDSTSTGSNGKGGASGSSTMGDGTDEGQADSATPATGESTVETIAILVIAVLAIGVFIFRKNSKIK